MILIKKAKADDYWLSTPGQWRPGNITPTGKLDDVMNRTANVSCPDCGQAASLSGHTISADGSVSPSLICPHNGCTFHDHIKLEEWRAA